MPNGSVKPGWDGVSTTFERRWVKIGRPAGGQKTLGPKARRWWYLPWRDPRKPLTISVKYRGGAECYYEIHARGSFGRFHGLTPIHDIMAEINRLDR